MQLHAIRRLPHRASIRNANDRPAKDEEKFATQLLLVVALQMAKVGSADTNGDNGCLMQNLSSCRRVPYATT
jgi:hypothetical protein